MKYYTGESKYFNVNSLFVCPMYYRNNVPNQELGSTGSVIDVKQTIQDHKRRPKQNIETVSEGMTERTNMSSLYRAKELDTSIGIPQQILTEDLELHDYKIQMIYQYLPIENEQYSKSCFQ